MNKDKLPIFGVLMLLSLALIGTANAQTVLPTPPPPAAPRPVKLPEVKEVTLPNGLRVAVVERRSVPLVSATLLIKNGASAEDDAQAGLADLTATMLLKGTKTRTATQIAEQIEVLGGSINSGANWNASTVSVNVTSDKIEPALTVLADSVVNPAFAVKEFALLKTQTLDQLNVALKQPGTLANFVAARYTFGEHAAAGTPETLAKLNRADVVGFYKGLYQPTNAVLVFVGDISPEKAAALTKKLFSGWRKNIQREIIVALDESPRVQPSPSNETIAKILVVDLPNSGQAAVIYTKKINDGRVNCYESATCANGAIYFPALVTNAVLGGGYSARLNLEIRIKRGLSYGAGSSFGWRGTDTNFTTRGQTKNISAPEVAELTVTEINKLVSGEIAPAELNPRKLALTGEFGRELSTNNALAQLLIELYTFDLPPSQLGNYGNGVDAISDADIKKFVAGNLRGGDLIVVGDYKMFADDLRKRFPNQKINVIPAAKLDLNRDDLQKRFDPGKPAPRKSK